MMTSAVFIGLLIILLFLCLLFVTAPWWGQKNRSSLRTGWMPIGLSAFILIFSVTWYWVAGRSAHIFYENEDATLQQIAALLEDTVPMPEVVRNKVDLELEKQKDRAGAQPTVWLLQAQLAMQHHDYIKAKEAYESAHEMFPDEIDISVSYAQAWYLSQEQVVTPELETFLEALEKQDPTQTGLINLLAVIAFHNGDYKQAISYWNELIPQYPENSSEALTLKAAVVAAKSKITK